jgi:hypothetical protein
VLRRIAAVAALACLVALVPGAGTASADEDCKDGSTICVGVGTPGHDPSGTPGGSHDNGGGAPTCSYQGEVVPCSLPDRGFFQGECYWQGATQPPPDDPAWALWGKTPGDTTGAFYTPTLCLGQGGMLGHPQWLNIPPEATLSPEELARRALAKARLDPPTLHLTPGPGKEGLVSLPVWLWIDANPNTWGPLQASDSDGPLAVTITASVDRVEWSMGDGGAVTCTSPGSMYDISFKDRTSPDCGYAYPRISKGQPGDAYTVTATTFWSVKWSSNTGRTGTIPGTSRTSTVGDIHVGEMQVVNGPR